MRRLQAFNVLTLYALAIAACGTSGRKPAGGGGGAGAPIAHQSGAGTAGTGGAAATHDCDAGAPANPSNPKACTGGYATWTGMCAGRYEQQECYVSEIANGSLNCLPPDAPDLVQRIYDDIASIGFFAEFVIDAAPDQPLSNNCEPLLTCCNQVEARSRERCYDKLDNPDSNEAMYSPCNNFDLSTRMRWCPAAGSADADSDGGATTTSVHGKYGLCCYRTCGHSHAI